MPFRVPVDESPVFLLYQDWALGLIFLKIWTRLVSITILVLLLFSFNMVDVDCIGKDGNILQRAFQGTLRHAPTSKVPLKNVGG